MELTQALSPRPLQRLRMSGRMRQALAMLQMPRMDLQRYLEEEIAENLFLEQMPGVRRETLEEDFYKDVPDERQDSLYDHLLSQWDSTGVPEPQAVIGRKILENLDKNGYLACPLGDIASDCGVETTEVE